MTTSADSKKTRLEKMEIMTELAKHNGGGFRFIEENLIVKLGTAGQSEDKPTNLSEAIAKIYGGAVGASPLVIKAIANYNQIANPNLVKAEAEIKIPSASKLIDIVLDEATKDAPHQLNAEQREKITHFIESRMDAHLQNGQQAFLDSNSGWDLITR